MVSVEVPGAEPAPGPVPGPAGAAPESVTTDFVECYLHHYPRLVRALRLSGADPGTAEELAQEAFSRALARWPSVRRGSNPPGYVYTAGFRLLRRHLRRASRWDIGEPPEPPAGSVPGFEQASDTRMAVEEALAAMPPRRRAAAVACLLVGLSPQEAGAALGMAAGTVRKHVEVARRSLSTMGDRLGP